MIKGICEKPTTNIILNGEILNTSHLRSRVRQRCPLLPQKALAWTIREEKEIKGIQIGKEVKPCIFADDVILPVENPKESKTH